MRRPPLKRVLSTWQRRLKLQDYAITIRYSRKAEDPDWDGTIGLNWIDGEGMSSAIVIWRKIDPALLVPTVVHELVHILVDWWRVTAGTAEYEIKERAINKLADAIIGGYGHQC